MSLAAGTRLGPYEILSPLGAGGMGEVYRARDTRLGREVAIKVLPEAWAADPDRLRRFEGEARAASALSDPHIVTVLDVGSAAGVHFFATELVEGSDLRSLMGEPIPVRKALDIASQIASGLATAHEKGIVHRDLKPENVLVTKKGYAKIADFGLAKLTESGDASVSQLPTSDGAVTAPGIVMGTVAYMSPEQARGAAVDHRSDQFAFGAILYEMLTGRAAFHRGSPAETLAAVLREEPEPLAPAAPGAPPPLRWLVERCLTKDPESRYTSTADLKREVDSIREHLSEAVSGPAPAAPAETAGSKRRSRLLAAAAVVAALAGGSVLTKLFWKSPPPEPPSWDQVTFQTGNIWNSRFGPDGKTILYSARVKGGPRRTYLTRTDTTDTTELDWPEGTVYSISSTGRVALGLMHHPTTLATMLSETTLAGGAPHEILDDVLDADWSPDGAQLAVVHQVAGRGRLEYPVGAVLFDPGPGASVDFVRFSPDGKRLALVVTSGSEDSQMFRPQSIEVCEIESRKTKVLTSGWRTPAGLAWTPSGRQIRFSARDAGPARGGPAIHAVDLSGNVRVVARAPAILLLQDVFRDGRALVSQNFWPNSIVFRAPGAAEETDLSWHENAFATDLSSDGTTLLLTGTGSREGAIGATLLRRTDGASPAVRLGEGGSLRLSPDGKWAIALSTDPRRSIVLLPTGAGQEINLTTPGMAVSDADWFPDSMRLLLLLSDKDHPTPRIYEQPISGGPARPLPVRAGWLGRISPDGRVIAAHAASGSIEVFPLDGGPSRPVPNTGPPDQIVRWSGDGSALFLAAGRIPVHLFRLDVRTGRRDPIADLGPRDRAGVLNIQDPLVTADGKGYAYSYGRFLNNLFVVTGLR